jgi:drug/metabolite transporter (DMT)-like permease
MPTEAKTVVAGRRRVRDAAYMVGVFWSLASALLWSTTFVTARYLLAGDRVDPMTLSAIRFVLGSLILAAGGLAVYGPRAFRVSGKDVPRLAGLGFFGMVGMSGLLFWGQRTTTAINASLIMQTCPVLILIAGLFIGERVRGGEVVGILVSLFGCLLVVEVIHAGGLNFESGHAAGDAAVFLAACSWTVYSVWGKPVVLRIGGFAATFWSMVFGALELVLLVMLLPIERVWPAGGTTWLAVLYLAALPTAVAFFAWYEAMNRIDLSLLNVMQYITPVATIALAWFLLHERVSGPQCLGIVLVLAGVAVTGMKRRADGGSC